MSSPGGGCRCFHDWSWCQSSSGFCVISVSFVSEHYAQRLHLSWYSQNTDISGSCLWLFFSICYQFWNLLHSLSLEVQRYGCDYALCHVWSTVPSCEKWRHLSGIKLADPDFGTPRLATWVETFVEVMSQGRRSGAPAAFNTHLDWVLPGGAFRSPSLTSRSSSCLIT